MNAGPAIAVDVGGTKIAASLVDEAGQVHGRVDAPTDHRGGERVVRQVIELAGLAARGASVSGVGVAVPAVVDQDRRVVTWAPNIRGWRKLGLAARLEEALSVPALLGYDGHAAAAGEHWMGAARGTDNVVMLVIGTGIGGGIIADGRVYRGSDGLAGAIGWVGCGASRARHRAPRRVPQLESIAAGPAIARRGRAQCAQDVFAAAAAGDARAGRVIDSTVELLGSAVVDLVSLLNPDLVVLGGGVGTEIARRALPRIRRAVRERAQPVAARRVRVVGSALGADAALVGIAQDVFRQFGRREGGVEQR